MQRLGVLFSITLATIGESGCGPGGFLITPVSPSKELIETTVVREGWLAPKVALIDVDGVITNSEGLHLLTAGENPVSLFVEKLDRAADDSAVKAVVLRINSPGGTVGASELMHGELVEFRRKTGKPVVAMMMDVTASGGYYLACGCDEMIAQKSTVTGSIGVLMQLFEITGTMAKIGVTPHTIKSGELKAGGSPFEQLSEKDRVIFQGIINSMYEQFLAVVSTGRPKLTKERVRELADGRVYVADQALEVGLIDRIGTLRDAIGSAKTRAGVARANVVAYHRPYGYKPNYYAQAPAPTGDVNIVNIQLPDALRTGTARFMFLWAP